MSWKLNRKFYHFRNILTKYDAEWEGSIPELVEYVHRAIPDLVDEDREPMERYYIRGEGRQRDENGLFTSEDSRFYQHLQAGRKAIASRIRRDKREGTLKWNQTT